MLYTSIIIIFTPPPNATKCKVVLHNTAQSDLSNRAVQVERGNRKTDFRESPADTKAAIAAAAADAVEAKAKTNGFTTIENGLIYSNLLKLMDVNDTTEAAGVNGQKVDAEGNALPAFWAGGSFADAIAMLASVVIKHNGDAKVGDFFVDAVGNICIKEGDVNRVLITKGVISSLAELMGDSTSGDVDNVADSENRIGSYSSELPNKAIITKNNITITVTATLRASVINEFLTGSGSATVKLFLRNTTTGVEYFIDSCSCTSHNTLSEKIVNINKQLTLQAGEYALKVYYNNVSDTSVEPSGEVGVSNMSWSYTPAIQRTEIGKNGIAAIVDAVNFLYAAKENNIFKFVLKGGADAVIDMPGVLATGSVSSSCSHTNRWGAKVAGDLQTISKPSTGTYVVPHNVGSIGFTCFPSATTDNITVRCVEKSETNFTVTCRNSSGQLADASFDYALHGSNQ